MKRIAVISDLHIGRKARSVDLCPHSLTLSESTAKEKNFLKHFAAFAKSTKLRADALCITGDISNEAHPVEFSHAEKVIDEIRKALGVRADEVYFTPGNHDVNWAVIGDGHPSFFQLRYAPISDESLIFSQRAKKASGNIFDSPFAAVWSNKTLEVATVNTAAHDSPAIKNHFGLVRPESIEFLRNHFTSTQPDDDRIRICILHHHPLQYSDPIPDEPDFSVLANAEDFLSMLGQHEVDIVIHGHKHIPRLRMHWASGQHPLLVLAAGSLSCLLDTKHTGSYCNQFHVIEATRRDPETKVLQGQVRTWIYSREGVWSPSERIVGLRHSQGFGSTLLPKALQNRIKTAVEPILLKTNAARWSQIVESNVDLAFATPEELYAALRNLEQAGFAELHGDENSTPDSWTIFRRTPK